MPHLFLGYSRALQHFLNPIQIPSCLALEMSSYPSSQANQVEWQEERHKINFHQRLKVRSLELHRTVSTCRDRAISLRIAAYEAEKHAQI